MKRTKRAITLLLVLALSIGLLGIPTSASYSDWAAGELKEAVELGLVPEDSEWDFRQNITRQEFAGLMVSLYALLHGSVVYEYETPFTDVDDIQVSTAYSLGIVSGMGNGTFSPNQEITREQMAVMLHNLLSGIFYEEAATDGQLTSFNDANNISSWAYDAAAFITEHGIIHGYSGGFHPQEKASREVAVVTAKRVAESYLEKFGQPIEVTLNGYDYALNGRPVWDGENLWLPAGELMSLLNFTNIDENDNCICAWYQNESMNSLQCNFCNGKNMFSPDTLSDVWIETKSVPYSLNGSLYITESMIAYIVGDFINFDSGHNAIDITINSKDMSVIQKNNANLFFPLLLKDASELEDTRINSLVSLCVNTPAEDWYGWTNNLKQDGITRTRFTLNAIDVSGVDMQYSYIEQDIPHEYVNVFRYMKENGMKTRYCLSYWDMANSKSVDQTTQDRLSTEAEIQRYSEYVSMVVTSLKGLVYSYELFNEPDANGITAENYIEMARRIIPIIRSIDPEARIVIAATSSYMEDSCQEYTQKILESDIVACVRQVKMLAKGPQKG